MNKKYYGFRDINPGNEEDEYSITNGIVIETYMKDNIPSISGKDFAVQWVDRKGDLHYVWRSYQDVVLFELDEFIYNEILNFQNSRKVT